MEKKIGDSQIYTPALTDIHSFKKKCYIFVLGRFKQCERRLNDAQNYSVSSSYTGQNTHKKAQNTLVGDMHS